MVEFMDLGEHVYHEIFRLLCPGDLRSMVAVSKEMGVVWERFRGVVGYFEGYMDGLDEMGVREMYMWERGAVTEYMVRRMGGDVVDYYYRGEELFRINDEYNDDFGMYQGEGRCIRCRMNVYDENCEERVLRSYECKSVKHGLPGDAFGCVGCRFHILCELCERYWVVRGVKSPLEELGVPPREINRIGIYGKCGKRDRIRRLDEYWKKQLLKK